MGQVELDSVTHLSIQEKWNRWLGIGTADPAAMLRAASITESETESQDVGHSTKSSCGNISWRQTPQLTGSGGTAGGGGGSRSTAVTLMGESVLPSLSESLASPLSESLASPLSESLATATSQQRQRINQKKNNMLFFFGPQPAFF